MSVFQEQHLRERRSLMVRKVSVAILVVAAIVMCASSAGAEAAREREVPQTFRWEGAFELGAGDYLMRFDAVDGRYHTPVVRLVVMAATEASREAIVDAEAAARGLLDSRPVIGPGGKGIVVTPREVLYELRLERGRQSTTFRLTIEEAGAYLVFMEHDPAQYTTAGYFLTRTDGGAVRPAAEIHYR